jgi:Icc-related predicted phosphoesterase
MEGKLRLVFVSDTHGLHNRMLHAVPDGDVLIHCGDVSGHGSAGEISRFVAWLCEQPHPHKLFVAGNHDAALVARPPLLMEIINSAWVRNDRGVRYLEDESTEIGGVKFYGSPWTPEFMNWYFMLPRAGVEIAAKWAAIPNDTQVLITHGPPYGILDRSLYNNEPAGCEALRARVRELPGLRLHVFGHIHEGYGQDGISVNAATCNEDYRPVNRPIVVDL